MPTLPLELTSVSFEETINSAKTPLLIDLWAPWCLPCKTMGPTIDKLAAKSAGKIIVAKIDVEQYPDILKKFSVRGIPTLLLFNQQKEISRKTGTQSFGQLNTWLSEHDIDVTAQPMIEHSEPLDWASFYDDAELVDFFKNRLLAHAEKNEIKQSIDAYWDKKSGTLSAAFVHSANPVYFERMTGLPIALARIIDQCGINSPVHIASLFSSLSAGKDYRLIALQFMHYFISGGFAPWVEYIQDPRLIVAVQQWIELSEDKLSGREVTSEQWTKLQAEVEMLLAKYSSAELKLEHNLATLLISLSIYPESTDDATWSAITRVMHFMKYQFLQIQDGWNNAERALPDLRLKWFMDKEKSTESGHLSDLEIRTLRDEWMAENSEFIEKENKFHQNLEDHSLAVNKKSQDKLFQLLHQAADY